VEQGFDIEVGVFHAPNFGGLVGVEDNEGFDRRLPIVENAVEEANQNALALFGAKDFFEAKVSFGIDESHRET
jgi:hypothetical protein